MTTTSPDYWRQLDVFSPSSFKTPVHVVGIGAIGSYVAETLCKMGVSDLTVYDFDTVEAHNLPNQLFYLADCGKKKAEALRWRLHRATGVEVKAVCESVDGSKPFSGVVFLCVDTMGCRRTIWEKAIRYQLACRLMVEIRMAAEGGLVYTVNPCNPHDVEGWEKTLYTDEEAEESACTNRAISSTVKILAGIAAHQIVKWHRGDACEKEILVNLSPLLVLSRNW